MHVPHGRVGSVEGSDGNRSFGESPGSGTAASQRSDAGGRGRSRAEPSGLRALSVAGRRLLALAFLLFSIFAISPLLLLPVGVPLDLFAVALIAAPGDP